MNNERLEHTTRFSRAGVLAEQGMTFWKHKLFWIQANEFLTSVTMHLAGGRVGFNHPVPLNVVDDQPITGSLKDIAKGLIVWFKWRLFRAFSHESTFFYISALDEDELIQSIIKHALTLAV